VWRAVCFPRRFTYIHCTSHVAPTPSLDLDITYFISYRFYRARFISYDLSDSPCIFFPNANIPRRMFAFSLFLSLFRCSLSSEKSRHLDSKLLRVERRAVSSPETFDCSKFKRAQLGDGNALAIYSTAHLATFDSAVRDIEMLFGSYVTHTYFTHTAPFYRIHGRIR